jgi:transposase
VKPYVKRLKNDAVDAEAISEAASRPTMRFVAVKSADQQGQAVTLKVRDLLMAQKVQTINALRSHLAEFGIVVPKGIQNLGRLEQEVETHRKSLPEAVVDLCATLLDQIATLADRIADLTTQVQIISRENETAKRLRTMPGIGPITAVALATLAPPTSTFRRGRDFAAWVGLTPKQYSTGGKTRLGRTSKMGQRDIRRHLVIGAMAVIASARSRGGPPEGSWLSRMLARKPRMLVAIALANKMARAAWAIIKHGGTYRIPAPA